MITISLPIIFIKLNNYFEVVELTKENYLFITVTFSSIFSILLHKRIIKFFNTTLLLGISKSTNKIELKKLNEYIFAPQNIRFFIYSIYFGFLSIYSYSHLVNKSLFNTEIIDDAIMQAFLVFLAFDSLRINSNKIKFLPTIILERILKSSIYDEEQEKNKYKEQFTIKNNEK